MATIITFVETMGYYILIKAVLFLLVQNLAGLFKKRLTWQMVKRECLAVLVGYVVIHGMWALAMGTRYEDFIVAVYGLACLRIAWRELKTLGGLLTGDWNTNHPDFCLFGINDKTGGCSFTGGGGGSRAGGRDWHAEQKKEDDFYYDARWYYQYGDGK